MSNFNGKYKIVDIVNESIFDYVDIKNKVIKTWFGNKTIVTGYVVKEDICYFSPRYNKWVRVGAKDWSDGATGAPDIDSFGWIFHDELKKDKVFADKTKCSNLKASFILSDILKVEGKWFRARSWFITTLAWGTVVK